MTGAGGQALERIDEATLERARSSVPLASLVGRRVNLRRAGREWSGLCPFHQEKTPSFAVVESKGFYHCFGCGAHGDAIRWMQEMEGLGFREAVASLLGGHLPDARRPATPVHRERAERVVDLVSSTTAGRWIWNAGGPARGELVERYLESRGLDPLAEFTPGHLVWDEATQTNRPHQAIDQLRFHPRCPVGVWKVNEHPEDHWLTSPAMIAPIADGDGAVWGVHVTYLAADGRSKAVFPRSGGRERPTRKMFGKVARNAVFLTPVGVTAEPPPHTNPGSSAEWPLVVGEGIETVWSFAQSLGRPCRAVATLSLENLQGGAVRLRDGSLPLWNVRADPDRAPFTLPEAGSVTVLVDADMKPLRDQKLQLERGALPVRGDIDGLKRAEICAALAAQAWRRAGARSVRCVRPRMGMDFNDAARAA